MTNALRAVPGCVGAIEHFKQFLVGQDAKNISALWQQVRRRHMRPARHR